MHPFVSTSSPLLYRAHHGPEALPETAVLSNSSSQVMHQLTSRSGTRLTGELLDLIVRQIMSGDIC